MKPVYYQNDDPYVANWLQGLIDAGRLPAGEIDEREIGDIEPADLAGFRQHHFFAGVGGWPLALDYAGWPEERAVWTGSCPCQSFSNAGAGRGKSDPRHLWPTWAKLIKEHRPEYVFGEQVAAAIRYGWLDDLSADLEAEDYTVGAIVLGAHSVGAPHDRRRLYFGAFTDGGGPGRGPGRVDGANTARLDPDGLVDDNRILDDHSRISDGGTAPHQQREQSGGFQAGSLAGPQAPVDTRSLAPSNNWVGSIPVPFRDGTVRLLSPDICPVDYGIPNRMGQIRGFGKAIVPLLAAEFISAFMAETGVPSMPTRRPANYVLDEVGRLRELGASWRSTAAEIAAQGYRNPRTNQAYSPRALQRLVDDK